MAIEILKEKERQKFLALVFVILLFLIFLVISVGMIKRKGIFKVPVIPPPEPKKIEINFEVLKSQALKELETFEEASLPEEKGRDNPFLPYSEEITEEEEVPETGE